MEGVMFYPVFYIKRPFGCVVCSPEALSSHCVELKLGRTSDSLPEFTFKEQPASLVVEKDRSARFHCQVNYTGGEKPVIRWYKNAEHQQLEDTARRYMLPNGTLHFKIVSHHKSLESDQGEYRCSATVTSLGTIVSSKASLTVAYIPKHFEEEPKDVTVGLGDFAAFECLIGGQPSARVTWYKGPLKLSSPRARFFPTGLLELGPITQEDYGTYACEAEFPEISRTSRMAQLSQISAFDSKPSAPKIIIRPRDQKVVRAEKVYLHCVAQGRDRQGNPPVISWLKDGISILLQGSVTIISALQSLSLALIFVSSHSPQLALALSFSVLLVFLNAAECWEYILYGLSGPEEKVMKMTPVCAGLAHFSYPTHPVQMS
ncbi:hypothetical protein Btru_040143 [Bulinus truncatus]|nr:hypothetical protein Btru_040143 [Bulinus truncatus]